MSTFQEMQQQLSDVRNRRLVILHIVEYLDSHFLRPSDESDRKLIVDNQHVPVPEEVIEGLVSEFSEEAKGLADEEADILSTPITASKRK